MAKLIVVAYNLVTLVGSTLMLGNQFGLKVGIGVLLMALYLRPWVELTRG